MEAGTKHKAHIEKKNGRAPRDARPIPSVLGDAGDELQQGAARILVDPPLTLGFFRGDAEFDDIVVTIIDSMHDIFPFQRCDRNESQGKVMPRQRGMKSEERRVGKEWVSTGRSRWWRDNTKKKYSKYRVTQRTTTINRTSKTR